MLNRRLRSRADIDIFFNKYLDGHPYLCRGINLSEGGLLALTFSEPHRTRGSFSLEFRLPGQASSLWAWARCVRIERDRQALQFIAFDAGAREKLARYLASPAAD
jgi:hypothetical protein